MTHRSLFAIGALVLALALPVAASAQHGGPIEVPAVPWNLTVEAGKVGTIEGTIGGGLLAQTTFIQRVNTLGGVAPDVPCAPNAIALVPYETDYIFYRAEKKP